MPYAPDDLKGICAMMPAFSTEDASSMTAEHTVDLDALSHGVDRLIQDGGDALGVICTTGTFGQCWNLFFDEFQDLAKATVEAVKKRVPLMIGVTSSNPREIVRKMKFVWEIGGEGVLLGLPYYEPLPIRDIATFYRQVAELFPDISIQIYHNPTNHKVHIPVKVFPELVKIPNIVAIKDSHRETREFLPLHRVIHGKIAHFVNQVQLYPYYEMGASGCWSHALWSGPWPVMALVQACRDGETERAKAIIADMQGGRDGGDGEGGGRRGHVNHEYTGYVKFGPPRPPHAFALEDSELDSEARARRSSARWLTLCDKYRPEVEARQRGSKIAAAV